MIFMIFKTLGMEGNFFTLLKGICENPTANIIFNNEIFPL